MLLSSSAHGSAPHDPAQQRPWLGALPPGSSHSQILASWDLKRGAPLPAALQQHQATGQTEESDQATHTWEITWRRAIKQSYRVVARRGVITAIHPRFSAESLDDLPLPPGYWQRQWQRDKQDTINASLIAGHVHIGAAMPEALFTTEHVAAGQGVVVVSLDPTRSNEIRIVRRGGQITSIAQRFGGIPVASLDLQTHEWQWRSRDDSGMWSFKTSSAAEMVPTQSGFAG